MIYSKQRNFVKVVSVIFLGFLFISATAFKLIDFNTKSTEIQTRKVSLIGNTTQLKGFFKALKNSKKQVVRIAHYGDSSLLGDVISEQLRYKFQTTYGGEGAGFISVCASDITMKESGIQQHSEDWQYTSLFLRNPDNLPFGVSGYVAKPSEGSWVKFIATNFIRNLREFKTATLYYSGSTSDSRIECTVDERTKRIISLSPGKNVQSVELFNQNAKSVELKFNAAASTLVYGVSFENGNGVYVDNYPITGNTGVNLLDISDEKLAEFKNYMDYNLIILHYGMNLPTPKGGTLKIYHNKMLKVIEKYKSIFPNAGIIMVGISDRIMKKGSRIVTSRETLPIIDTQIKIAKEGGVAFWNLFEAMGGEDSMEKWVESAPPLALKDYRHFTHAGGEIVADLFYEAIIAAE